MQRGNELREYRFIEESSELLPIPAVAPRLFEIEPELNGGTAELGRPGDWANRDHTSDCPSFAQHVGTTSASAELEADVAYLLKSGQGRPG